MCGVATPGGAGSQEKWLGGRPAAAAPPAPDEGGAAPDERSGSFDEGRSPFETESGAFRAASGWSMTQINARFFEQF